MSNSKLFVGALLGAAALGVYLHLKQMKKDKLAALTPLTDSQVKDVIIEETAKAKAPFTDALLRDYDVIIPTAKVSKAVRAKAQRLTEGRFALMPDNIVKPLKLENI